MYLSEIAAAGVSPVTHLISVGFASEAQAEKSNAMIGASAGWATYLDVAAKAGTYHGTYLQRTLATWGSDGE